MKLEGAKENGAKRVELVENISAQIENNMQMIDIFDNLRLNLENDIEELKVLYKKRQELKNKLWSRSNSNKFKNINQNFAKYDSLYKKNDTEYEKLMNDLMAYSNDKHYKEEEMLQRVEHVLIAEMSLEITREIFKYWEHEKAKMTQVANRKSTHEHQDKNQNLSTEDNSTSDENMKLNMRNKSLLLQPNLCRLKTRLQVRTFSNKSIQNHILKNNQMWIKNQILLKINLKHAI